MVRSQTVFALLICSAVALAVGAVVGVKSRDRAIDALTTQQIAAQRQTEAVTAEKDALAAQVETLTRQVASLKTQLDGTYAAVEVGGPVDFPVLRGMARPGDTVKRFAEREGTTPTVVRALNPWLKDDQTALKNRQALWIPKRGR